MVFFSGKSKETFEYLKEIIDEKLQNIEKAAVRNEYKLKIYHKYFLPSIRFLLTVHDVTATDLKKIDTLSDKYVKKWAGLPRCATNTFLHMSHGMNIKSISALYHETHAISHARTRLKGDSQVNHALDCRISRESEWTRKQSTTVKAQETLDLVEDLNTVCGVRPGFVEVPATITKYLSQHS